MSLLWFIDASFDWPLPGLSMVYLFYFLRESMLEPCFIFALLFVVLRRFGGVGGGVLIVGGVPSCASVVVVRLSL